MKFIFDLVRRIFSRNIGIKIKPSDCAFLYLSEELEDICDRLAIMPSDVVILCIGSRDIPGDSVGPLVGNLIKHLPITTVGNLDYPITGENLLDVLSEIPDDKHIIVVDASFGKSPGTITIAEAPCLPGAASGKQFGPIGTISILGIVQKPVELELSNAALAKVDSSLAMELADTIAAGINKWYFRMEGKRYGAF